MPISIAQLKANLRTINVQFYEDNLSVTYRPGELTPHNTSALQDKIDRGEGQNILIESLCSVMTTWDIVDEEGEPLPITPAVMDALPGPLLLAISEAIADDARPKAKSAGRSFAR